LPEEYDRLRSGEAEAGSTSLIQSHMREVLVAYAAACGFS
jgi:tagatose-1,6-bisphosphate aldolase non-catalytic subunit AgaZ/GatZ